MDQGMRARIAAALAAALLLAATMPAGAVTDTEAGPGGRPSRAAPTFGSTLPPVGFVRFCGRRPEACAMRPAGAVRPRLTRDENKNGTAFHQQLTCLSLSVVSLSLCRSMPL